MSVTIITVTSITSMKGTLKIHCFYLSRLSPFTSGDKARPSCFNEDGRARGGREGDGDGWGRTARNCR